MKRKVKRKENFERGRRTKREERRNSEIRNEKK